MDSSKSSSLFDRCPVRRPSERRLKRSEFADCARSLEAPARFGKFASLQHSGTRSLRTAPQDAELLSSLFHNALRCLDWAPVLCYSDVRLLLCAILQAVPVLRPRFLFLSYCTFGAAPRLRTGPGSRTLRGVLRVLGKRAGCLLVWAFKRPFSCISPSCSPLLLVTSHFLLVVASGIATSLRLAVGESHTSPTARRAGQN